MNQPAVGALLVVAVLVAVSLWVLDDARRRTAKGRPVVATYGEITLERPEAWAALCLVVFVVFVPMYLVARSAS